jgi:hypothetical protein
MSLFSDSDCEDSKYVAPAKDISDSSNSNGHSHSHSYSVLTSAMKEASNKGLDIVSKAATHDRLPSASGAGGDMHLVSQLSLKSESKTVTNTSNSATVSSSIFAESESLGGNPLTATGSGNQSTKSLLQSALDDPERLNSLIISWCRHKKVAELSYALAHGADVNTRDESGNTPLIGDIIHIYVCICTLRIFC